MGLQCSLLKRRQQWVVWGREAEGAVPAQQPGCLRYAGSLVALTCPRVKHHKGRAAAASAAAKLAVSLL
jgi:hypothetical protein